jgi:hypothetical protein
MASARSNEIYRRMQDARLILPENLSSLLPPRIASSLQVVARSKGVSPYAALGIFTTIVLFCSRYKTKVFVGKGIDWQELPLDWHMMIAPSGANKSPIINAFNEILETIKERIELKMGGGVRPRFMWNSVSFRLFFHPCLHVLRLFSFQSPVSFYPVYLGFCWSSANVLLASRSCIAMQVLHCSLACLFNCQHCAAAYLVGVASGFDGKDSGFLVVQTRGLPHRQH